MLTKKEILTILNLLSQEVVVERTTEFPYTVTKTSRGYSKDEETSKLQGKLNLMFSMAR